MRTISTKCKILTIFFCVLSSYSHAQNCDPSTPVFPVNLVGNPTGTWISPMVSRQGLCCGNTAPNTCVQFDIILDPAATGINFDVFSGAMPGGALFYQINCGPLTSIGTPICLNGPGPHVLTFCKPGGNVNEFIITSITDPQAGNDIVLNDGCSGSIGITGLNPATIVWNSVYPGTTGAYNNYLDCTTGCSNVLVTGQAGAPAYVDYMVCGTASGVCAGMSFCDTIRVTFNPTLVVGIQPQPAVICAGMSGITLTATGNGGTPPYTFTWSNGTATTSNSTSQVFASPGVYTVTMQDNSNCPPVQDQVTVVSYPVPVVANAGTDQILCKDNPVVTLAGTVTGTNNAQWHGGSGAFNPSATVPAPVYTPTAAEIASGSVTLVLEANNGACTPDFDTVVISFRSFGGTPQLTTQNISCAGMQNGSINLMVSGPFGPYSTLLNGNAATFPASGLSAGTYQIMVIDNAGCDTVLNSTISEPAPLTGTAQIVSHVSCNGGANGQAQASVTGGTPPYSYSLNGTLLTTTFATGLTAASHQFTVTDAAGCTIQLPFTINQPAALSSSVGSVTNVSCYGGNNGSATINVSGGAVPYQYTWTSLPGQSGPTATGLSAGTFPVTITDANNCQATTQVTLTEPSPVIASISVSNVSCSGYTDGSAQALVAGGVPPYNINWSTGSGNTVVNNLPSGNFTATITDQAGCLQTISFAITEPAPLNLVVQNTGNISCAGFNDGTASVLASGGTPGYQYYWNSSPQQYSSMASSLPAGNYMASVIDQNGCFASASLTLSEPPPLVLQVNGTDVSCYGLNDGTVQANVSGGVPPYYYEWTGGLLGPAQSGLPAGYYSVSVSDANNCPVFGSTGISEPGPVILVSAADTTICPGNSVNIWAQASGGQGGYYYSWTHNLGTGTSYTVSPQTTASYIVNVQDSTGCAAPPDTILVSIPYLEPEWISASVTPGICEGDTAIVSGTVTAPVQNYTTTWSHGLGNGNGPYLVSPTSSTVYTFTLMDQCGNTIQDTAAVTVHERPDIFLPNLVGEGCPPLTVQMPAQPGVPAGSQYFWSFGNGLNGNTPQPEVEYQSSGNFYVSLQVTTPFGCSTTKTEAGLIRVHSVPTAYFEPDNDESSMLNPVIYFKNHSLGAVSYNWNFGDGSTGFVKDPNHVYTYPGTYPVELSIANEYGCEARFTDQITIVGDFALYIPNAFSPNGDGNNDDFAPKGVGIDPGHYEMKIFNRWGELIYVTDDITRSWDGTAANRDEAFIDTYVYKIKVKDIFNKEHEYTGHVSVIR